MTIGKILIRVGSSLMLMILVGIFTAVDLQAGYRWGIAIDLWAGVIVSIGIWYPYELKD